jgi:hypothetical protein
MLKKIKRKRLAEGSNYDDEGAFDENKKINAEDKAEAKKIMKTGKMAPEPEQNEPKIKMRCGKKDGGFIRQGKPRIAKKGWR